MAKLKYYVLTSKNLDCLKRHFSEKFSNLPKNNTVVVINTLDEEYIKIAGSYCEEHNIEYYVTDSNGTPARGKNSVIDIFLNSDNEYMVQIDGDDYLTPHGVWMYNHLSLSDSPPDAVFLWRQKGWGTTFWKEEDDDECSVTIEKTDPFCLDYDALLESSIHDEYRKEAIKAGRPKTEIEKHIKNFERFWKFQQKYCEPLTQHCRLTFQSRKAAEIRFPENITVGEDTLHYYLLKNESKCGNLNVVRSSEYPPTYIYDQTQTGTVVEYSAGGQDTSWIDEFLGNAYKYEQKGILHEGYELPDLTIDYPTGYQADECGYGANSWYHELIAEGIKYSIYFPHNASFSSVLDEMLRYREQENLNGNSI